MILLKSRKEAKEIYGFDVNDERKSTGKMMDALPMSKPGKPIKIQKVNTIWKSI